MIFERLFAQGKPSGMAPVALSSDSGGFEMLN